MPHWVWKYICLFFLQTKDETFWFSPLTNHGTRFISTEKEKTDVSEKAFLLDLEHLKRSWTYDTVWLQVSHQFETTSDDWWMSFITCCLKAQIQFRNQLQQKLEFIVLFSNRRAAGTNQCCVFVSAATGGRHGNNWWLLLAGRRLRMGAVWPLDGSL